MRSRLSCLRSKHGTIHESNNICISLGKAKKPSMLETNHTISTAEAVERNKRGSNAKKALSGLKNLIVRYACKLKIKNYLGKSGCSSKNRSLMKKPYCCACISSEKRSLCTNGLFKIKSILLKGGGGGDHGGGGGSNTHGHGGNNGGGVNDKKGHDQKKQ
ncbi:hypothetical protein PTKIN_Ptkin11bG0187400 [Pterospermum kingtungense]